jgi:hypothetical protein
MRIALSIYLIVHFPLVPQLDLSWRAQTSSSVAGKTVHAAPSLR